MTMPDVQDDPSTTAPTADGAPLEIGFAQASDAEELAALVVAAYGSPTPAKQTTRDADLAHGDRTSADEIRASMADGMTFLVARDGDRIIACSGHRLLDADTALMEMMAVAPDARLTGVAKLLGRRTLVHLATVRGCTQVEIHVFSEHAGMIERYEREGFVATGETRPVPAELSKVAGLHFVVLRLDLARALQGR
ncbi:Acetyltransferase (GNAT) family protein [Clavibacter michiganensis]|uniref:Acetyltransferase (GNAT) family protein n=1 Tax=Clavibacter michiganensis TaxID=28447 RepID=A0A251YI10_9MICO|nr:GNAT family N-acetyltransferase [Clavibacter michiganensis]OUE23881.1 Acetyltransferase (GNAT) family protein [Clavibacter michiganensis]